MKQLALFRILVGFGGVVYAQEMQRFSFAAGAGFTTPVGTPSAKLDAGWNIRGGAGVNCSEYLGTMLDVGYDSMGVGSSVLNNVGYGGGRLSVFSVTLNPIVHLVPKGPVDIYVTGGGGHYRQN